MKPKEYVFDYIFTLMITMFILFSLYVLFYMLDSNYRQLHEAELTTKETTFTGDGYVTNYTYAETPYAKWGMFIFFAFVIVPFLLVIVGGIIFIRKDPTWRTFRRSLYIPLTFAILTIILNIIWIYIYGETLVTDIGAITMMSAFVHIIIVFILFCTINGIIIYYKRNHFKHR